MSSPASRLWRSRFCAVVVEARSSSQAHGLGVSTAIELWDRVAGLADVRGVYRPTAGADLIPEAGSDMATWTAALSAGAEF